MAFLDGPTPLAFAHRGFARNGDENSMAAFERAVALGYRYLETDVRVTADGVALAFHDASLDRTTDRSGRIRALPWSDVRSARIAGREPIPLLAELLSAWPHVQVNIDVKDDHSLGAAIDVIRQSRAIERVCVGAFADDRVAAIRAALGPSACTSLGPLEALRLRLPGRPRRAPAGQCAQVPFRIGRFDLVDARYLEIAHNLGLQVHVWTVNARADMERALDLGVDGIMTDRADVLRDVLAARGAWPR